MTGKILTGEIEILTAPGVVGGGLFLSLGRRFRSCGVVWWFAHSLSVALCGSLWLSAWRSFVWWCSDKGVTVAAFCGRFCGSQTMRKYNSLHQRQKGKRKAARCGRSFCFISISSRRHKRQRRTVAITKLKSFCYISISENCFNSAVIPSGVFANLFNHSEK